MRYIHTLKDRGVITFRKIIVSDEYRVVYGVDMKGNMFTTPLQVDGTFSYSMNDWTSIPNKYPPKELS